MLMNDFRKRRGGVRRMTRQKRHKHRAKSVKVCARRDRLRRRLFRRHVINCTDHTSYRCDFVGPKKRRNPEIRKFNDSVARQHQICGFQVAMNDSVNVCTIQSRCDLNRVRKCLAPAETASRTNFFFKRPSVHEFHRVIKTHLLASVTQ